VQGHSDCTVVVCCSQERTVGDAKRYNDIIRHETLRVAVCDMLEGVTPCPESLRSLMASNTFTTHNETKVYLLKTIFSCQSLLTCFDLLILFFSLNSL